MPSLPSRHPRLVLNVTGLDALTAGYLADKATTAAPVHAVDDTAHSPVRSAAFEPAHRGETNRSSEPKPVHNTRVMAQDQVHDLTAALYAALYGASPAPGSRQSPDNERRLRALHPVGGMGVTLGPGRR